MPRRPWEGIVYDIDKPSVGCPSSIRGGMGLKMKLTLEAINQIAKGTGWLAYDHSIMPLHKKIGTIDKIEFTGQDLIFTGTADEYFWHEHDIFSEGFGISPEFYSVRPSNVESFILDAMLGFYTVEKVAIFMGISIVRQPAYQSKFHWKE